MPYTFTYIYRDMFAHKKTYNLECQKKSSVFWIDVHTIPL